MQGLSVEARLLSLYLLASPHGNMLGCFRLPLAYAADDLRMPSETVRKGLVELVRCGFCEWDPTLSWVLISNHFKYNPIENPNQGKSVSNLVASVPRNSNVYAGLISILHSYSANLPEGFLNGLGTVPEPSPNQYQYQYQVTGNSEQETGNSKQKRESVPELSVPGEGLPSESSKEGRVLEECIGSSLCTVAKPTTSPLLEIYKQYPRKIGKRAALEAIEAAVSRLVKGEDPLDPMTAHEAQRFLWKMTAQFAQSPSGQKGDFVPHPQNFFKKSRYLDDTAEWNRTDTGGNSASTNRSQGRVNGNLAAYAAAFPEGREHETALALGGDAPGIGEQYDVVGLLDNPRD